MDASRVTNEIYPDSSDTTSGGSDQVKFQYNVDGTLSKRTDQRGTVIDYTYNNRRQLELQKVTTLGSMGRHNVDGHVRAIKRAYDDLARVEFITSYSGSDGTGTVRNQIKYVYDSNNMLWIAYQSHEGAVGSTPAVVYAYDTSTTSSVYNDGLRLTTVTPPSGNALTLDYGSSNGVDDRLMRVQNLKVTLPGAMSATNVVTYSYNGTGRLAEVDYGEADVRLDYWGSSETNDNYEYYDRLGRIRTQRWYDYGASSVADQFDYTHDYAGNRLTRDIPSSLYGTNNKDHAYTYDGVHRSKTYDKGTLSGSTISGTPVNEEDWTLDALGNWTDFIQKASGSTTLDQDRTHNDVNEIGTITATTGTNWADPVHDAAGNMTEIPKPSDLANSYDLTYDAFNRLVKVEDGMTVVAEYEYDGLNRRIIKDDQTTVFHYYYNESWQCVEVREDSDTDPSKQYYWHTYYIDALALRYHDATGDGDFQDTDEIQYGSHDANFNVTALYKTNGDVRERYEYTPYGDATILDADFSGDADGASDVDNAYLFTGRRLDEESRLYYFRNRFYESRVGRFITRDPVRYTDGTNLFAFVGSSPVGDLDPFGLARVRCRCRRSSFFGGTQTVNPVIDLLDFPNPNGSGSLTADNACKKECKRRGFCYAGEWTALRQKKRDGPKGPGAGTGLHTGAMRCGQAFMWLPRKCGVTDLIGIEDRCKQSDALLDDRRDILFVEDSCVERCMDASASTAAVCAYSAGAIHCWNSAIGEFGAGMGREPINGGLHFAFRYGRPGSFRFGHGLGYHPVNFVTSQGAQSAFQTCRYTVTGIPVLSPAAIDRWIASNPNTYNCFTSACRAFAAGWRISR